MRLIRHLVIVLWQGAIYGRASGHVSLVIFLVLVPALVAIAVAVASVTPFVVYPFV